MTYYGKYSSHSTSQCKDAAKMKAKLSGGTKECAEATNSWKKEHKAAMAKEMKVLKKQNKQLNENHGKVCLFQEGKKKYPQDCEQD